MTRATDAACACALPSRPRKSGLPDLRTIVCETRASPSFVAGRVDRVSAANAGGVGGLRLLRARGAPTPDPSPPLASLAGGGERMRWRPIIAGRYALRPQCREPSPYACHHR